jgi:hypothetical protein
MIELDEKLSGMLEYHHQEGSGTLYHCRFMPLSKALAICMLDAANELGLKRSGGERGFSLVSDQVITPGVYLLLDVWMPGYEHPIRTLALAQERTSLPGMDSMTRYDVNLMAIHPDGLHRMMESHLMPAA